ncbi:hypothetical protein AZ09_10560 [Acetobacter aceti 1023]|nr:hypothetical protein AZ09_10560 [Acetobacter aceti 1023]
MILFLIRKLKILGPYTPEHEGPFCTREGKPVEVITKSGRGHYPVVGYIGDKKAIAAWTNKGRLLLVMKARPNSTS